MDLQVSIFNPTLLYCDNKVTIDIVENPVYHARTKYIEINCHFVRDKVQVGFIIPTKVSYKGQLADILTKALSKVPHWYLAFVGSKLDL